MAYAKSLKGATNIGTWLIMIFAVSIVTFGAFNFYDGINQSYNLSADNSTSNVNYIAMQNITTSVNNTANSLDTNTSLSLGSAAATITNIASLGWGAAGAVIDSINLFFEIPGLINSILTFVISAIGLPSWILSILNALITAVITLMIVGIIYRANIKDDVR